MKDQGRLKIAHFTQFLGIGGLEKIILELALMQKEQGHEVTVIVYDYEQRWVEFFREKGLRVFNTFSKKEGFDPSLIVRFSNFIRSEKFDVIQSHDINPLIYLTGTKLFNALLGRPSFKVVHTAHTLDHVENSKKVEIFERFISFGANQLIVVSPKIQNFYLSKVLRPSESIHLIENGISQKQIPTDVVTNLREKILSEYGLDSQKPLGLCLSRVVPLKDQEFLIKAFMKRPELQLLVVGPPSDKKYFDRLEEMIKQNLNQNIKLIGPRADVLELNQMADFYVSASTHEGLPVSVLEAMSVGTPCLVSNIPGHQILNQYEKIVDTFQLKNEDDFLKKLDLLILQIKSGKDSFKNGIRVVEKFFSTKRMVSKYNEVYRL